MKKSMRYAPEVRERAVRMVLEHHLPHAPTKLPASTPGANP